MTKKKGSIAEYSEERSEEMLRKYFDTIASVDNIRTPDIFQAIANMPSTRFWVSETRAAIVVANIERGDRLSSMTPKKRQMFLEIHRRTKELQRQYPDLRLAELVAIAVRQQAPEAYLEPDTLRIIVAQARKRHAQKKLQHLLRHAAKEKDNS